MFINGIVRGIIKSAVRFADIGSEFVIRLTCGSVENFLNRPVKYELLKKRKVAGQKGVYIFFDDKEVLYVGQAGRPKKKKQNGKASLDKRIQQHIKGNVTVSSIMKYFYDRHKNFYTPGLWDEEHDKEDNFKRERSKFKDDYFNKFLKNYYILIISIIPRKSQQNLTRKPEDVPLMLERVLIAILNPKINT